MTVVKKVVGVSFLYYYYLFFFNFFKSLMKKMFSWIMVI